MTAAATEELAIAPLSIEPDEIARFIAKVYDQHPHGKSFVPRWSGAFLKHIIFDDPKFTPDHALGAYMGDQLVGLIMAQPYAVHMDDRRVEGAFGSWLAVTPQGAGQFAAIKLLHELRARLAAQGAEFLVGVAYRSGPGVGLDFGRAMHAPFPRTSPRGAISHIGPVFWTGVRLPLRSRTPCLSWAALHRDCFRVKAKRHRRHS